MSNVRGEHVIPCTVGILTYNSGTYLTRALESVKEFGEILIADGGSTDETLSIAKRYGARVVAQGGKGAIKDFAIERNRLLEMATYDWFFYIDSDEAASPQLVEEIRRITNNGDNTPHFYNIRWQYVSGDMATRYRSFKSQYQIRFFNRATGARFTKRIHEKVRPPQGAVVGTIDAPWCTPLDVYMDWNVFRRKVYRNAVAVQDFTSKNPLALFQVGILPGLISTVKWFLKNAYVRIRYPWRECIPLRYELYKLYEVWYMVGAYVRRYVQVVRGL